MALKYLLGVLFFNVLVYAETGNIIVTPDIAYEAAVSLNTQIVSNNSQEQLLEKHFYSNLAYQSLYGNTEAEYLRGDLFYNFNKQHNYEWTFKYNADLQRIDKESYHKNSGFLRYGKSITDPWYVFAEYFQAYDEIKYLINGEQKLVGTGYWFFNNDFQKFSLEFSFGEQKELYTIKNQEIAFFSKITEAFYQKLAKNINLKQNFYYLLFSDNYEYFYDVSLENLLTDHWSIAFIYEYLYRQKTIEDLKSWDAKFLVVVKYSFKNKNVSKN